MRKIVLILLSVHTVFGFPLDSKQTDAPWFVFLNVLGLRCGGSLVNDQYVVTAAHCFDNYIEEHGNNLSHLKIYFGEWKLGQDPDCGDDDSDEICDNVVLSSAKSLKIHEQYDKSKKDKHNYDIAVITLKRPPRTSDIISSALLPDEECEEDFTGKDLSISGFGEIKPQVNAVIRKKMDIKVFGHEKCSTAFQNKAYDPKVHICGAGKNDISTCKGDSGGGAVNQRENEDGEVKTYLQGIVSFGSDVCGDRKPTGLLKVSCFVDWINGIINPGAVKKQKNSTDPSTSEASASKKGEEEEEEEDEGY